MKNIILYSALIVFIGVFTGCNDDDEINFLPSNTVGVDVDEVTIFDSPFTVNFTTSNSNVSSLAINGGLVEDRAVTISDKKGSSEFTSADFGADWKVKKKTNFTSTINFGSSNSVSKFSISLIEALVAKLSAQSIAEFDSAVSEVSLIGETKFNALGTVVVERKVITEATPDPAFVEVDNKAADKTYEYKKKYYGVDYNLKDTIVYRITATSGTTTESTMVKLPVVSKMLPEAENGSLSDNSTTFAFMPVKDGPDVGVMTFVAPRSITSADVQFLKVEEGVHVEKFYELNKFSTLVDVVDGNALSGTVTDAVIGDVYAFKYPYKDVSYYGYFTVTAIHSKGIGDAMDGIDFSYQQDVRE